MTISVCGVFAIAPDIYLFFFSSRRRHTRYIGDWSSDVCSSDLAQDIAYAEYRSAVREAYERVERSTGALGAQLEHWRMRSEERRVGKSGDRGGSQTSKNKNRNRNNRARKDKDKCRHTQRYR